MSHGSIEIRGSIWIGDVSQPNILVPLANIINSWSCFYKIDTLIQISFFLSTIHPQLLVLSRIIAKYFLGIISDLTNLKSRQSYIYIKIK